MSKKLSKKIALAHLKLALLVTDPGASDYEDGYTQALSDVIATIKEGDWDE